MIDIKRLVSDMSDAFEDATTSDFPLLVGNSDVGGNRQAIEDKSVYHLSHLSHLETSRIETESDETGQALQNPSARARGIGDRSKAVGKVGTVGNASKNNDIPFPPITLEVGKVGKEQPAGATLIPRQVDTSVCFICNRPGVTTAPLVPVLSEERGAHHWTHTACWPEHARRCAAARAARITQQHHNNGTLFP